MAGRQLADDLSVSPVYLSQCVAALISQGWVVSRSGPDGGYALAPGLRRLDVRQVVEAIEGPIEPGTCVGRSAPCDAEHPCGLHDVWSSARSAMAAKLAKTSAI